MKKIILFLSITIMAITSGFSQSTSSKEQNNKKSTEITFVKTTHDFGTIKFAGNGTYKFVFKNTGKEALIIERVKSTCGCTIPNWTREPIKKGEKGNIEVKYNTNIAGNFSKTVTVYSSAKNSPVKLTIKGLVQRREK